MATMVNDLHMALNLEIRTLYKIERYKKRFLKEGLLITKAAGFGRIVGDGESCKIVGADLDIQDIVYIKADSLGDDYVDVTNIIELAKYTLRSLYRRLEVLRNRYAKGLDELRVLPKEAGWEDTKD